MAVTANYDGASQDLTVNGDSLANLITVGRDALNALIVNGGAVPITGGVPTIANTDLIEIVGDLGDDVVTIDEGNGPLPVAEIFGNGGHDTLTGGSGGDTIGGDADNDTIFGRAGIDLLLGGTGNDSLVGGAGGDQMFGEDGDDRMIWNQGDGSDLMEGGIGTDTVEVNGGNGAETFTITANGARVRFDRIDPAPFALDIGTSERLFLFAGGGDDIISTAGNLAALISITVDGGAGNDTILGSNGVDLLIGGDGNDFVDGQQGNDVAFLGAGNDVFQWDPGDGSDTVEGQGDIDTLLFNGSAGNEIFVFSANGSRVLFTRNVGNIVMDLDDVESFTLNALGGTDNITVNNLSGTDATSIAINLSGTIGGAAGDAAADSLLVNGTNGADTIDITGAGTSFLIAGLTASVTVTNAEGANDSAVINGLGGNDTITARTLPAGIVSLVLDGGAGDDTILGSQGADIVLAGSENDFVLGDNGNDTALLGSGEDVFQWNPGDGNDVVEGQDGLDELRFIGSNASENITISPNGGRVILFRDVASVTMDLDDVERIRYDALGGADNVVVANMAGTDLTDVEIRLAGPNGGGDGAVDTVTVTGTDGGDPVIIASSNGVISVNGLPSLVFVLGAEAATDRLVLNGQGGDDVVDGGPLAAGLISLTFNGGLGEDVFFGSPGNDLVTGGDGNDTVLLGAGDDVFVWNPGDDNDTIEGQAGTDTLRFNGANVAETIVIGPNGGRAALVRDVANVIMDLNDTEVIALAALGGADIIIVNNLSVTDVTQVEIDLASTVGGATGDGAVDTVHLNGNGGANTITLTSTGSLLTVTGLPTTVTLSQFETTSDQLTILALGGNDVVSAASLVSRIAALTIDGGDGHDAIISNGDGTYLGGTGDDLMLAGLTNSTETIDGGIGTDTLDTQSWGGTYTINMVTGVTNYSGESFLNFENLTTGAGNDTITGTTGANVIATNDGVDTVNAGLGNDIVAGGAGGDTLNGGGDIDTLDYRASNAAVNADLLNSQATGGHATGDVISGFENVWGSAFGDTIFGNAGANELHGFDGPDTINGLGGNDTIFAGAGGDFVLGGANDDVLVGNDNVFLLDPDILFGEANNDAIYAERSDTINGGTGVDIVYAINSFDFTLDMGATSFELAQMDFGNDVITAATQTVGVTIIGSGGNDTITGSPFADGLFGGVGNDTITGGNGNDGIVGDLGIDSLTGGEGNDLIYFDNQDNFVSGGNGNDAGYIISGVGAGPVIGTTVNTGASSLEFVQDLAGGSDTVLGSTMTTGLIVAAGGGNDVVDGSTFVDLFFGELGNDSLFGNGGNDSLVGQGGLDLLAGGAGIDALYGNAGAGGDGVQDIFRFQHSGAANADAVYDFEHLIDKIDLSAFGSSFASVSIATAGGNANVFLNGQLICTVVGVGATLTVDDFIM